ncbi:MAG: phage tail protein [Acidimicrobiales bacterium]
MTRRRADWLVGQLPVAMVGEDFFRRFVSIFQEVGGSFLDDADNVEHIVDPTVAPLPLVPWLGSWIGVESIDPSLPDPLQRRIVRQSAAILAWRGTRRGMAAFLELLTGAEAEIEENGGVWREGEAPTGPPLVRIRARSTGWMPDDDFVTLVRAELPAQVALELYVGTRRLWPVTEEDGIES